MSIERREFIRAAGMGLAAGGVTGLVSTAAAASQGNEECASPGLGFNRQGPKEVIRNRKAVASSQSPIVTRTMLDVLRQGGNAVDAIIAGNITQATVQLDMTNHTGTVSALVYEAKSGKVHYLNSMGTLHPDLPPFRTYPQGLGGVAVGSPMACIPGFMPGMAALYERFGSRPWKSLVEPAIPWAEEGFPLDEFTRGVLEFELSGNTYFPAMRDLYTPQGLTPSVGEKLRNPALAKTLRGLADNGPEHFTSGEWGQEFVKLANELGWGIVIDDLSANPPRWEAPTFHDYHGYTIAQPSPPERQAVFCAIVLGILKHVDVRSLGHYTESADSLYYMAHALRRAGYELGQLNDPQFFDVPLDIWMSDEYHAQLAGILKRTRPKQGVDLTQHVALTTNPSQLRAFGWSSASPLKDEQPSGSCELTCVDKDGNWVQMMNTLQSGGIAGMVVGGVPMIGSHASFNLSSGIAGWLGLPGCRMRSIMSNTMILKDGAPMYSLGSPGNVHCTVPQMISNVLDFAPDPYAATELPRMLPMRDDHTIEIEARISEHVVRDIARIGAKVSPLPPYDFHMGSFQQAWKDPDTGLMNASTDPRRAGEAGGID
jgi:gamma-glutamyltranspeptidase/glutathione hydrolase